VLTVAVSVSTYFIRSESKNVRYYSDGQSISSPTEFRIAPHQKNVVEQRPFIRAQTIAKPLGLVSPPPTAFANFCLKPGSDHLPHTYSRGFPHSERHGGFATAAMRGRRDDDPCFDSLDGT
jgi:hypothetical protein